MDHFGFASECASHNAQFNLCRQESNLQILFSEICIDQHSCSIHILLAKVGVGVGGGGGSTLSVFSHPLKSYFILYLSFANDLTRDLCIQNLFMFC